MRFSAILFDLDGTLVDTITLYKRAWMHGLRSAGLQIGDEDFHKLYTTGTSTKHWIGQCGGNEEMLAGIKAERDTMYHELLTSDSVFLAGAEDILKTAAAHPSAIVTGSWKSYVDAIDKWNPVTKHFDHVITADDTDPFHKPHPHGLFLAADRLGVKPEDCIYIGDQAFDIDAADAAGMTSCLVCTQYTPDHAKGKADMEIASLTELMGLLE